MPSGRTHDRITWLSAPLAVGAALVLGADWQSSLTCGSAYLFSGLMFGGDLDIHSVQYLRWGPLRWIWLPYRRLMAHRSPLSHGLVIGTVGRLLYLTLIVGLCTAAIAWIVHWKPHLEGLYPWMRTHWLLLAWSALGLEAGALSHSISDGIGSWMKRMEKRRYARRGHR
jgi:uncharacterized metal-binding protein